MKVITRRIVDRMPARSSSISYHYDYRLYDFQTGDRRLTARTYADTPQRASFIDWTVDGRAGEAWGVQPLQALISAAVVHLWGKSIREFYWYDRAAGAYRELDPHAAMADTAAED